MTKKKGTALQPTEKKIPEKPIDIKPSDFVIAHNGHVYKVGKKIKEGFNLLHQYDGEWSLYGDIELERFEHEFLKIDRPIEEIEKLEVETFEKIKQLKKPEMQMRT